MAKVRTIIQENNVSAVLDAEFAKHPGLEDVYQGLEWRIARNPEAGYLIPQMSPPTRIVRSKSWRNVPPLLLTYRVDAADDEVTIVRARVSIPAASTNSTQSGVDEAAAS